MKNILFFTLIFFLIGSCKKNKPEVNNTANQNSSSIAPSDTVFPGSYFPVYPGSQWNYLVNDSILKTDSTASNYQTHSYLMYGGSYSTPVLVPFFNGEPIYKYQGIHEIWYSMYHYEKLTFLSETLGTTFTSGGDTHYGDFNEHMVVASKTLEPSGDSVITVNGHFVYGPNLSHTTTRRYVKNIGLVQYYILDTLTGDTLYKKKLQSFYINH